jgi:hypothetical protein
VIGPICMTIEKSSDINFHTNKLTSLCDLVGLPVRKGRTSGGRALQVAHKIRRIYVGSIGKLNDSVLAI